MASRALSRCSLRSLPSHPIGRLPSPRVSPSSSCLFGGQFGSSPSLLSSTSSSSSCNSNTHSSSSRFGRARFFSSLPPPLPPLPTVHATSWWNPLGGGGGGDGGGAAPLTPTPPDATPLSSTSLSSNPDVVSFSAVEPTTAASSSPSPSSSLDASSSASDSLPSLLDSPLVDSPLLSAAAPSAADFSWYNPSYQVMECVEWVHSFCDVPYFAAIIASTVLIRSVLLPVALRTQRNSSRFAHMKPELEHLQRTALAQPDFRTNPKVQQNMQAHMQALFKKYDCNPIRSLMFPVLQLPVFMSFFFGLKEMHTYFPGLETGGALWFVDLSAPDPYMLLPIACSASFLLMLELGADGMAASSSNPQQAQMMKTVFRGMGVLMVPFTMNMPASVFMYWCTSNAISVLQVAVMRVPGVKKSLGIWDPPAQPVGSLPPLAGGAAAVPSWKSIMENARRKADEMEATAKGLPPPPPPTSAGKEAKEQAAAMMQNVVFREEPKKAAPVNDMDLAKTLQKKRR